MSLHSLLVVPVVSSQHGGLVFLLIYSLVLFMVGWPLLLLEMFLGQFSGLAPAQLFRHLSPVMAGLGVAMCGQALIRAVLETGVMVWMGALMVKLFTEQRVQKGTFTEEVLNKGDSSLEALGELETDLVIVLGIVILTMFVLTAAGTRSVGKVSCFLVPVCYILLTILVINSCLSPGGSQGVITLLQPDWRFVKEPGTWLEAASQVIFSLQLGLGGVSSYSRYNKYHHNIVQDSTIIITSHLVWVILATLLTTSLLGSVLTPGIPTTGVWLATTTLLEESFLTLSTGWFWAGLYFLLLTLVGITSVLGYVEAITSSLVILPELVKYKPVLSLCVLVVIFLLDLVLATQGGIHVYHLLLTYISDWPAILFTFIIVVTTILAHGTRKIINDISSMTIMSLPHLVTSHLSVCFTTIIPLLSAVRIVNPLVLIIYYPHIFQASLGHVLFKLSEYHLEDSMAVFGLSLSEPWAVVLGWSIAGIPFIPVVFGICIRMAWVSRGVPLYQVSTLSTGVLLSNILIVLILVITFS